MKKSAHTHTGQGLDSDSRFGTNSHVIYVVRLRFIQVIFLFSGIY
jgi:hypothetical protein